MTTHRNVVLAALANLTDAAKFEDLVRAALPSIDTRFKSLAPTGVGAHGKTVRDPVDGIGFAWNNQGQTWVTFQATTQQTKVAEKLHEDYDKALDRLPPKDKLSPHAVVALAINTDVGSGVVAELIERGRKDDVLVYVVSVTKLADVLTESANHGLAHAFLGVRPRLANEESLRQASGHFLDSLESTLFGQVGSMPQSLVLDDLVNATKFPLIELIGTSGQGKTSTVVQLGKLIMKRGGIFLHIPETVLEGYTSLSAAIDAVLEAEGWQFEDSPGSFITSGRSSTEVLVAVDDLQRLAAPQKALDKVRSWSRQLNRIAGVKVTILCTRWPQTSDLQEGRKTAANRISCVSPQQSDLVAYARTALNALGQDLSEYDARSLLESLGDDPLLLGVHLETYQHINVRPTPREVWVSFIERAIQISSETSHLTPVETKAAWDWLGDRLLGCGRLARQLELMKEAYDMGHARSLAALLQSGILVRSIDGRICFRHDRLRDWHVGSRILAHYQHGNLAEAWPYRWDPYFNQAIADTVVQSNYDERLVNLVAENRPEALFGTLWDQNVSAEAMSSMQKWASEHDQAWSFEPGVEFAVRSIIGVRHPELSTILDALPPWPAVQLARMAHGDVNAALKEFMRSGLSIRYLARDAALEAGLAYYGDRLMEGLKRVLQEPPGEEWIKAAIDLASVHPETPVLR